MSLTRAQLIVETKNAMDSVGSNRWGTDTILRHLDLVFRSGWRSILDENAYYTFAERTVTTDAQGRFALTDLNSGSGDSLETFYRILTDPNGWGGIWGGTSGARLAYGEAEPADLSIPATIDAVPDSSLAGRWVRNGNYIQTWPRQSQQLTVRCNFRPQQISALSADDVVPTWPLDFEMWLPYAAGAFMLNKGGAETEGGAVLQALADDVWASMMHDVGRISTKARSFLMPDSAAEWAGH